MAPKPPNKMQTNLKRCPLLKVTTEEVELDKDSRPTGNVRTNEEFNECYKSFCMAWNGKGCAYFEEMKGAGPQLPPGDD